MSLRQLSFLYKQWLRQHFWGERAMKSWNIRRRGRHTRQRVTKASSKELNCFQHVECELLFRRPAVLYSLLCVYLISQMLDYHLHNQQSPPITPSLFHSRLKTRLFYESSCTNRVAFTDCQTVFCVLPCLSIDLLGCSFFLSELATWVLHGMIVVVVFLP